jgi:hypothetical protein
VDDAAWDMVGDEGESREPDGSHPHLFSDTLGDGWVEVEPGIYRERSDLFEPTAPSTRRDTVAGPLQPDDGEPRPEHDDAHGGRLRRWLRR